MTYLNRTAAILPLDGRWEFALRDRTAWGAIRVPGCWEAQGHSKASEGPAFYRRTVTIPPAWAGQPIFLEFDAVSYACRVSLNGTPVGEHVGLWTPFALDVTTAARPGDDNLLELEIFKPGDRYPMRSSLAGFLPDVATTFGGIWQSCRLATYTHAFRDVTLDPEPDTGRLRVRGQAVASAGGTRRDGGSRGAGGQEVRGPGGGARSTRLVRLTSRWKFPGLPPGRPNTPHCMMWRCSGGRTAESWLKSAAGQASGN